MVARSGIKTLLADMQDFFGRYVTTQNESLPFVAALWTLHTYLYPHFDATPYLMIRSATKRSGKSRCAEIISFMCSNPVMLTGLTAAVVFRSISEEKPALFCDESESMSSEAASSLREALCAGYRRGTSVRRTDPKSDTGYREWPLYCPKVFILIGDTMHVIRDRSIVFDMVRGTPKQRFIYSQAKAEGQAIRERAALILEDYRGPIVDRYTRHEGLKFLTSDRDEEIWLPLFAVCSVIEPEAIEELKRIAVDMATEKTTPARRHVELKESEEQAAIEEYGVRLLRDMHEIMVQTKKPYVLSADAIDALKALPTSPWRKFRGDGLTVMDLSNLLAQFSGVVPKSIKVSKKENTVRRGYKKDDIEKALAATAPVPAPAK